MRGAVLGGALALAACAAPVVRQAAPVPGAALSASDRAWVERTLASLSLREKAGQIVMPWIGGDYVAEDSRELERLTRLVAEEGIGGVVVSVGMPLSYAAKLNALQRRAPVPLLVASDMENGPGMRMAGIWSFPHLLPQGGATDFPPAMALGATGDDSLAEALGRVLATEARAVGVHVTFGPVVDVNSNPGNPIINTRAFGEDPALVSRLAAAFARGARTGGLQTVAKHFPGHGDTQVDSHLELPTIEAGAARLDSVELAPYRALLPDGVDGVMTAHIAVTGVEGPAAPPATLSAHFLTRVLREELRFPGLVYTDAMDMGAIVRRFGTTESLTRAIDAGADVLLMPVDVRGAVETVTNAVRSGRLSERRLDASVRRVLEAKARAGLPRARLVDLEGVSRKVGARGGAELASRIAERSIVLARDARGLVPLRAPARVLVVLYAAPTDPVAGRTFVAALAGGERSVESVRVDDRTTAEEFTRLRRRADSVDVVIAAAFVSPLEGRGSIAASGGFPGFVQGLTEDGRDVCAVSFGSPYLLEHIPAVPAYLLAWGGQDASQRAAAAALLGAAPITGRLPVSLPPFHARGEGMQRGVMVGAR